MQRLYDRLAEYQNSDYYGFHMPGHKRNLNMLGEARPYEIDITEIEGFDDLHHARGILKEAQERAAKVYHADETHFLINGSTAGILSAIAGITDRGDTILVARNCHKSVYHAIEMYGLKPVYLMPGFDSDVQLNTGISVSEVRRALEEDPKIRAVVLVSPTYDGVLSDIETIAGAVHEKGIPIIVDEAHGAHFGFHSYFPENSNTKGADIVIHSLHKTLPSLTQTALLHMNGRLVRRGKVHRYLDMLQTSSPSYLLMASMDACVELLENHREELFAPYAERLKKLREELVELQCLRLVQTEYMDPSKIVISTRRTDMTGRQLYRQLLEEYHLQLEMAAGNYVLALTSVGDTDEGMRRLTEALYEIDRQECRKRMRMGREKKTGEATGSRKGIVPVLEEIPEEPGMSDVGRLPEPETVYSISEMMQRMDRMTERASGQQKQTDNTDGIRWLPWQQSVGYVSTEYAYLYPPGCPLVVPGERISRKTAGILQWYQAQGFTIEGLKTEGRIGVWVYG